MTTYTVATCKTTGAILTAWDEEDGDDIGPEDTVVAEDGCIHHRRMLLTNEIPEGIDEYLEAATNEFMLDKDHQYMRYAYRPSDKSRRSNRAIDPVDDTVLTGLTLLPKHRTFAKAQPGGMSAYVRDLINKDMKKRSKQ